MQTIESTKQEMTLLKAVEQIVELSRDSRLEPEFFSAAAEPINYLAGRLELTPEQCVLMALFINNSDDGCTSVRDLAKHLGCSTTRILSLLKEIDGLVNRDMVRCNRERRMMRFDGSGGGITYRVPWPVVDAFIHDRDFEPTKYQNLTNEDFFGAVCDIFDQRAESDISTDMAAERLQSLMADNSHLAFVQQVKKYKLDAEDENLLLIFAHLLINENNDHVGYRDIDFFYDRKRAFENVKNQLGRNLHPLEKAKIIECTKNNGFFNTESFRIADTAKMDLFPELDLDAAEAEDTKRRDVVKHEDIVPKQLFFDKSVEEQISDLAQLLDEEHYRDICNRMKDSGYRCGFTCLFYGAPGTGKTESVLQLARQTGRDIMQVNISQIKSMWVGESEKNTKRVFDIYRAMVEKQKVTPILFFNEADAIISKRFENVDRSVDQMYNSMQNIILQEMETLNGILIATTNLAKNFDKAFERRFLYKVRFNKPTREAREHIWRTMLPKLSDADISVLAEKYDFSGGQIENIARHYTIDTILHSDQAATLATLIRHCDGERIEKNEKKAIGFGN